MTRLLVRLFIKKGDKTGDPDVRQAYGVLSGGVGIACNLLLFLGKLLLGFVTGAISIVADAVNNLSDAGSSIITLLGFKMAGKPADPRHPYGHGRIEYLSALFISVAIILMGVELLKSSVERILNPAETSVSLVVFVILIASILVKLWMFLFNRKLGRRINSSAMEATALDSISDSLATLVVLIGMAINYFAGYDLDGYMGVIVAAFILITGIKSAKDSVQPLIGAPPDEGFVEKIHRIVMAHPEIRGMHELLIHDYGPAHADISLHVEMSSQLDMVTAHEIITSIEDELESQCHCDVTIHIDPVVEEKTEDQ